MEEQINELKNNYYRNEYMNKKISREFIDEKRWNNIKWKNQEYKNIQDKLKTREGFNETLIKLITDKNLHFEDKNQVLNIMEQRLTNVLQAGRNTELNIDNKKLSAKLENILRDTCDIAKDIFNERNSAEINKALEKVKKVNKIKTYGAIAGACALGLTNQYINRKITEKRTGKKGFVGDVDFINNNRVEQKKDKFLLAKKIGASALMAGMVFSVMKVKNIKDFARKLEFTGNGTELRESMTRDYLGFLNWLVFGGFAAKGVANLLDKKGENLFNFNKKGKGLKHWLNEMNLKTHNEIAAKGKDFAKKNLWKLNLAHASGIAYSAITLGYLLPMLNAKVTEHKAKKVA